MLTLKMPRRSQPKRLSPLQRLRKIRLIIDRVDSRCLAADGPVTPTLQEMNQTEISEIYRLAGGDD